MSIKSHRRFEEEQGQSNIDDFDQVSKKIEHPVDSIVMPLLENPIGSLEIKSIVPVVSHEDQIVDILLIDFIFGDQRWMVNVHDLLVCRKQLKLLMVRSHIGAQCRSQKKRYFRSTFSRRKRLRQTSKSCHANVDQKKRHKFL